MKSSFKVFFIQAEDGKRVNYAFGGLVDGIKKRNLYS